LPNTPEAVCDLSNGVWKNANIDEVPQCDLGCCLLGDQASFVTQIRCGHLASLYGLEINFRSDITNEMECIMNSNSEIKGACVFDQGATITCRMTSKTECLEMGATEGEEVGDVQFHEGYLCSAEELGALCSPSEKTTCVEGKDGVYFLDTCGNVANIYDYSKINNQNYWAYIVEEQDSCGFGNDKGNANDPNCGNCDYMLGSTCGEAKFGEVKPNAGDNICKDLSCTFDYNENGNIDPEEYYRHGETWCYVSGMNERETNEVIYADYNEEDFTTTITQGIEGTGFSASIVEGISSIEGLPNPEMYNLPGTRHYRMLCYNGEVMIEPCEDYRNQVCVQGRIDIPGAQNPELGFRTAACRINQWQDCIEQKTIEDCQDLTKRDCFWYDSEKWGLTTKGDNQLGLCVPTFAPGFNFWDDSEESEAALMCSRASDYCTITYERDINSLVGTESPQIIRGEACATTGWQASKRALATLLGDCGRTNNYLGYLGSEESWKLKQGDRGEWN